MLGGATTNLRLVTAEAGAAMVRISESHHVECEAVDRCEVVANPPEALQVVVQCVVVQWVVVQWVAVLRVPLLPA